MASKKPSKGNKLNKPAEESSEKLFLDDFFIPVPGELFNDLQDGVMSAGMWIVYCVILRQVNFESGIWEGSAEKIEIGLGRKVSLSTIRNDFKRLEQAGYIKPFRNRRGVRGNYPTLVHGYRVRFGALRGHRLNAQATTDWSDPVYERDVIPASAQPSA